ncbi:MAG: LPXTG cell wall anchor domain-containing protein, partial [Anaerolineae bacterium]|nr:LPXTG cell wall anchor domain-containing protein [Anaerolineae bacterium]
AQEGAGSYVPADGAVEGFVWSGMDASFNPTQQPPVVTFAQILAAPVLATLPQTGGVAWPMIGLAGGLALVLAGLAARKGQGER